MPRIRKPKLYLCDHQAECEQDDYRICCHCVPHEELVYGCSSTDSFCHFIYTITKCVPYKEYTAKTM